jgi:phage major head subunit gpT-like protein
MIINQQTLSTLFRGFQMQFQGALAAAPSQWDKVAMLVPSTTSEEQYGWLGTLPNFREWVGDRVIQNLKTHDFVIKNKSFELTVAVKRNDLEDDRVGIYSPIVQTIGMESKTHPDQLVFSLMAAGDSKLCYDGQYFFDTDHPIVAADGSVGSYSNFTPGAAAPWYLLDLSRSVKPFIFQRRRDYAFVQMTEATQEAVFYRGEYVMGVDARVNTGYGLPQLAYRSQAALDVDSYTAARTAMQSQKGDNGKPLAIRATHLVVPPSQEGAARKVLMAEDINGTTNTMRGTAELVVVPWLA